MTEENKSETTEKENIRRLEETFEVSDPAKLVVKNIRGKIKVTPTNGNQIKVVAVVELDSGEEEHTQVNIFQKEDGTVRADIKFDNDEDDDGFFGLRKWVNRKPCRVHFTVEAPVETSVYIKNVSGSIDVQGMNGSHHIKTVSGNVFLSDLSGEIDAGTVSGKVEASNLTGPADLDSVSGSVRVDASNMPRLNAHSVSGKVIVTTPLGEGPYELKTVSGSVRLIVPDGTGCSVKANTLSGRLKTDQLAVSGYVGKRKWDVDINGGGPAVSMKTVSGSLYILSDEDAPAKTVNQSSLNKQNKEDRMDILSKVSEGGLSVEEAMTKLG